SSKKKLFLTYGIFIFLITYDVLWEIYSHYDTK
ncbi:hypothetical protein A5887_002339, partial [Enterococcus faecium]